MDVPCIFTITLERRVCNNVVFHERSSGKIRRFGAYVEVSAIPINHIECDCCILGVGPELQSSNMVIVYIVPGDGGPVGVHKIYSVPTRIVRKQC